MKRRHRRGRANPTGAQWLLIAGAAGAVGVLGYLVYKANTPAALTAASSGSSTFNQVLAPGTLATVNMSLSKGDRLSIFPPAGGNLTTANPSVSFSPTGIVMADPNGAFLAYAPQALGTTTCSVTYTDTNNASQSATFTINVNA
jgi:hypothetical protein